MEQKRKKTGHLQGAKEKKTGHHNGAKEKKTGHHQGAGGEKLDITREQEEKERNEEAITNQGGEGGVNG